MIIVSKSISRKKKFAALSALILAVFLLIILFVFRFFNISVLDLRIYDIPVLMEIGFYGLLLFIFPGVWFSIGRLHDLKREKKYKAANSKERQIKKNRNIIYTIIFSALIPIIISTIGSYVYGVYTGGIKVAYLTIGNQYVVMCEDNDSYVLSKCSISNDEILTVYKNRQKVINKTGVLTEKIRFNYVDFK